MEVWDVVYGVQILFLDNLKNPWRTFFSADESQLFVFYPNKRIEIYDLDQQELIQTIETNADRIDFSSDRKYFAAGDYTGSMDMSRLTVTDFDTGDELFGISTPGIVMRIEFSPDGGLLIAGVQRGNHFHDYVWDISTGELKADLIDYQYGLTFSPDSSLAVTSTGQVVNILSAQRWVLQYTYNFSDPYRNAIPESFSLDGKLMVFGDRNDLVFLAVETGEELLTLDNECDAKFSPNGTTLFTWCYLRDLELWGVLP